MRLILVFLIGALFGLGIVVSGMGNPAKVVNFFDVTGAWDPSLMFVMGGALAVTAVGFHFVLRRRAPLLGPEFHLPLARQIDARLVLGSATFGVGWGIAGFCPGGALPVLGALEPSVWIFAGAMGAGILVARLLPGLLAKRAQA